MRKIIFFSIWLMALMVMAVPAKHVKCAITLADGTKKEVVLRGDEHVHFYEDAEGNAFVRRGKDLFVREEKAVLTERWQKRIEERNELLARRAAVRRSNMQTRAWGDVSNPMSGKKKGLVILVNFSDKKMQARYDNAYYNDFFNKVGFKENDMAGSVHDFFYESSYGKFDLTFDVIGPVTVGKPMSYYGENDESGMDKHPAELVIEACKLADQKGVDFSTYDWDGDGYVDQVFLVYAGYSEASGAASNTIWPHEYDLNSAKYYGDGTGVLSVDGVKVDTYAMSSELAGTSGTTSDGIGTACHEFSHCLCLPDLYDAQNPNSGNFGMNAWDLMDYGCYAGKKGIGECPTGYTSYERMYCGWLTPTELTSPCKVSGLKALAKNPEAYIIYNQANRNEFYILENRQQIGFHSYDPAHGLLIIHVDFDKNVWINNAVNSEKLHQRVTIIPADNNLTDNSLQGDVWPGASGDHTALTDTSIPAATLFNANRDGRKFMGKPIEKIAERNACISFSFDGGIPLPRLDVPVGLQAIQVSPSGFTATWQAVSNATSYELELTEEGGVDSLTPTQAMMLDEDFSGFNNGGTSDGMFDIASKLDEYTKMQGWKGMRLYTTPRNEVKVGSSAGNGTLSSPWLKPTSGNITLLLAARRYKTDAASMIISYASGNYEQDVFYFGLGETEAYSLMYLQGVNAGCYLSFKGEMRAYISRIMVLDGLFQIDELTEVLGAPMRMIGAAPEHRACSKRTVIVDKNSHVFTGLSADKTYYFRVRALAEGYEDSEWSESFEVQLKTDIKGIETANGNAMKSVETYDLQGRAVRGTAKHGIYIRNGRKILR